jgi:hypothetical protein
MSDEGMYEMGGAGYFVIDDAARGGGAGMTTPAELDAAIAHLERACRWADDERFAHAAVEREALQLVLAAVEAGRRLADAWAYEAHRACVAAGLTEGGDE